MDIIPRALREGRTTLSEYESKQILGSYGIPVSREILVRERDDVLRAADEIGYPLVLKGCSPHLTHKSEKRMVRMDIRSAAEALDAFDELFADLDPAASGVLVQELVKGPREFMVGLTRDPHFGPCVMFGLGGIFTEALSDVTFRLAPLEIRDAFDMMEDIRGRRLLDAVRGMEAVDRHAMADILVNTGRIGLENERIREIDVNPLIIRQGKPVAVDALVILS